MRAPFLDFSEWTLQNQGFMKFLLFLLFAYLAFRFLQNLMRPMRNQNSGGFRVIFPDGNSSPKEKDISDKAKIISKGE